MHLGPQQTRKVLDDVGLTAIIIHLRRHPRNNPGCVGTSRSRTAPGSPVNRSARVSMVRDRLNLAATGIGASLMRVSEAAADFVSTE
jgi:hypothetical protein